MFLQSAKRFWNINARLRVWFCPEWSLEGRSRRTSISVNMRFNCGCCAPFALREEYIERQRMKYLRWLNVIVILTFLSACGSTGFGPVFPTDTALPPPIVTIVSAPDPSTVLTAYLDAFKADDYNA